MEENDLKFRDVKCVKLKSKYEGLYSSFHVAVRVDSAVMSQDVTVLMSPDAWPDGVFVKRYFKPKDGAADNQ